MPSEGLFRFSEIHLSPAGNSLRGLFRFLPPASRAELLLGSMLIVLSLLGTWWTLRCRADALALERDSAIVEGHVVQLWVTHGKGQHYWVAYEYPATLNAGAAALQGEVGMPKECFDRLKVGGPVAVKVCRTDPTNHLVLGARPRMASDPAVVAAAMVILALIALAGIINVAWWRICRRTQWVSRLIFHDVKNTHASSE